MIHELQLGVRKGKKRIGRGGKRGTTSGRGSKGQKARSGASVDPLFEGGRSTFLERLKKVRGFKSIHKKKYTVTLSQLERAFAEGETVTLDLLIERNVVPRMAKKRGAKVVATGVLSKSLNLDKTIAVTRQAESSFAQIAKGEEVA